MVRILKLNLPEAGRAARGDRSALDGDPPPTARRGQHGPNPQTQPARGRARRAGRSLGPRRRSAADRAELKKQISAFLSVPQWRALRAHAAAEGRSVSAIVVEALGPLLRSAAVDSAAPTDAD